MSSVRVDLTVNALLPLPATVLEELASESRALLAQGADPRHHAVYRAVVDLVSPWTLDAEALARMRWLYAESVRRQCEGVLCQWSFRRGLIDVLRLQLTAWATELAGRPATVTAAVAHYVLDSHLLADRVVAADVRIEIDHALDVSLRAMERADKRAGAESTTDTRVDLHGVTARDFLVEQFAGGVCPLCGSDAGAHMASLDGDRQVWLPDCAPTVPRRCYYISGEFKTSDGQYVPSLVVENEPGHIPMLGDGGATTQPWGWGATVAEAKAHCREVNATDFGITEDEALIIVASSMAAERN